MANGLPLPRPSLSRNHRRCNGPCRAPFHLARLYDRTRARRPWCDRRAHCAPRPPGPSPPPATPHANADHPTTASRPMRFNPPPGGPPPRRPRGTRARESGALGLVPGSREGKGDWAPPGDRDGLVPCLWCMKNRSRPGLRAERRWAGRVRGFSPREPPPREPLPPEPGPVVRRRGKSARRM
jgi:hypothetical protein